MHAGAAIPRRSGAQIAAEMDLERETMKKKLPGYVAHIIEIKCRARRAVS